MTEGGRRRGTGALVALLGLLAASCSDAPANAVTECEAEIRVGVAATDILFVVDDSGSMAEEQENLRQNLSDFVDLLAGAPIRNDFRIGLTNTSVSAFDGGTLYTAGPNLGPPAVPYPAGALVAIARDLADAPLPGQLVWDPVAGFGGARVLDAGAATLVDDFKANVLQGTSGSGKEQPFAAIRSALEARLADGSNAGFLRPGARLAVVILTDEDDCTDPGNVATTNPLCRSATVKANDLEPVGDLVAFLQGDIAGEPRDPIVAVIAGFDETTLAPTGCGSSSDDPTRLDELVTALGPARALKDSICASDFGPGLDRIADLLVPQTVPLENAPQDPRMLVVSVTAAGGAVTGCPIAAAGTPEASDPATGAVFEPASAGAAATLSFQNACVLRASDRLDVRIVCAG